VSTPFSPRDEAARLVLSQLLRPREVWIRFKRGPSAQGRFGPSAKPFWNDRSLRIGALRGNDKTAGFDANSRRGVPVRTLRIPPPCALTSALASRCKGRPCRSFSGSGGSWGQASSDARRAPSPPRAALRTVGKDESRGRATTPPKPAARYANARLRMSNMITTAVLRTSSVAG
jgi:hypothetical protein